MNKQQGLSQKASKVLENMVLQELDLRIRNAATQVEKVILELFKSAVLKKYKDSYDVEVLCGEVKEETLDKCVDFLFTDTCAKFRLLPGIDDATKDYEIEQVRSSLGALKEIVIHSLTERGVSVV